MIHPLWVFSQPPWMAAGQDRQWDSRWDAQELGEDLGLSVLLG